MDLEQGPIMLATLWLDLGHPDDDAPGNTSPGGASETGEASASDKQDRTRAGSIQRAAWTGRERERSWSESGGLRERERSCSGSISGQSPRQPSHHDTLVEAPHSQLLGGPVHASTSASLGIPLKEGAPAGGLPAGGPGEDGAADSCRQPIGLWRSLRGLWLVGARRMRSAYLTGVGGREVLTLILPISVTFAVVVLPIMYIFDLLHLDKAAVIPWYSFIIILLAPAIAEETFFRVLFNPHPSEGASLKVVLYLGAFCLFIYVAFHPLNAWLFTPSFRPIFYHPSFLVVCVLLGGANHLMYFRTGSIWPAIALHWGTVVIWGCLGGKAEIRSCNQGICTTQSKG